MLAAEVLTSPGYNAREFAGGRMRLAAGASIVLATALGVTGCAAPQPIYIVADAPVPRTSQQRLTMSEVQTAIQRAGRALGWYINPDSPGHLIGQLTMRTHVAVVDIEHDTRSYSIKYRDSANLNAAHGMIHHRYNEWVQSLDRGIRSELLGM